MRVYVDLGVVRIQEYILRTSGASEGQLRKRRGASRMISEATASDRFRGFQRNDETYHVEGVAHLTSDDVEGAPSRVHSALAQLRRDLPNAYLRGSWAVAESYQQALTLMNNRTGQSEANSERSGELSWVPAAREESFTNPCDGCGAAPREQQNLCADCVLRDEHGRNLGSSTEQTSAGERDSPEQRALSAVAALIGREIDPPRDLMQIARSAPGDGTKRNHLATIYADGNSVGAWFRRIAADPGAATGLSHRLDTAIKTAGHSALTHVTNACISSDEATTLPASVTILAADDVLVSVPATFGWLFVTTLVREFNASMAAQRPADAAEPAITLTAGIVFSHAKEPIERAIREADLAMRAAKRASRGQRSDIGWRDLTQRGSDRTESQRPVAWFEDHANLLAAYATLPGHQRSKWLSDLESADGQGISDAELLAYFRREAVRLNRRELTPDGLELEDIAALLGITRWWSADQSSETSARA